MERTDQATVELSVSDYSQLESLAGYLPLAVPQVPVTRTAGLTGPGEQGALDTLMIAADSSVLVAVVNVLPQFLKSRKRAVSVTLKATVKGRQREMTVTAANVEEVLPVIDRFLRG
jgi:membrane-associated two-gene conflict system component 1 (EACC1)